MILETLQKGSSLQKKELVDQVSRKPPAPDELAAVKKYAMTDPKSEGGMLSFAVLARTGSDDAVNKLLTLLKDPAVHVRQMAGRALSACGGRAVAPLLALCAEADDEMLEAATLILRRIEDKEVDGVIQLLQTGSAPVKVAMARILGSFKQNDKAVIALIKSLASPDPLQAAAVIDSLVEIGPRILAILNRLIQTSHPRVVDTLFKVMDRIGEPAKALIHEGIESTTIHVRRAAVRSLTWGRDEKSRELLLNALADRDGLVARGAADSLTHQLDDLNFMVTMRWKHRDSTHSGQRFWLLSIFQRNPDFFEEEILSQFRSGEPQDRLLAAISSPLPAGPLIFGRLVEMLNDPDYFIRELAIERLAASTAEQLAELTGALGDSRQGIMLGVIEVLRRRGAKGVDLLLELVQRGNNEEKRNAAHALGHLGDTRGVEPLRALLIHGDDWVRRFAIRSLGMLGDVESMLRILVQGAEDDQNVASRAISDAGAEAFEPLLAILRQTPQNKREKLGKAMLNLGKAALPLIEQAMESEEDENIRFWLMKAARGASGTSEFV